jgi:hypothetical protein
MRTRPMFLFALFVILCFAATLPAQQNQASPPASNATASPVPRLIKFNGTLLDAQGQPMKGPVGVTFSLYAQQSGGAALWMETQNVETDSKGNYTVLLGVNSANGVSAELFNTGEARWLGIQPEQQAEQPRILLVSVPYALKAGDAQTLGGLPPSAFAPANSSAATNSSSSSSAPSLTVVTPSFAVATAPGTSGANAVAPLVSSCTTITADGTATANLVAKFTAACQIHQSQLFDNGTNVGIGNGGTAPAAKLDVFGTGMFRGALTLPAINAASSTATAGFASQPFDLLASAWNTLGTPAAVSEHFRWQAQPVGSNTTSPSSSLNLLFASGAGTPAQTGLSISSKGIITFAAGQTLPPISSLILAGNVTAKQFASTVTTGTAPFVVSSATQVTNLNASLLGGFPASHFGTITGITTAAGSGVQGGVTTGIATLSLIKTCTSGQILSWNGTAWVCTTVSGTGTITGVTAGTGLSGGGTAGNVTLNLASNACAAGHAISALPFTCTAFATTGANTFTGDQTVTGNISETGHFHVTGTTVPQTGPAVEVTDNNDVGGLLIFEQGTGIGLAVSANGSGDAVGIGVVGQGRGIDVSTHTGTGITVDNANDPATTDAIDVTNNGPKDGIVVTSSGGHAITATTVATATAQEAIHGVAEKDADYISGVTGFAPGTTRLTVGVVGQSMSTPLGIGVLGFGQNESTTFVKATGPAVGVWGDTIVTGGSGVEGTEDNGIALSGTNNSAQFPALFVANLDNSSTANPLLTATGNGTGDCMIFVNGDLKCTGSKSAVVPVDGGSRKVALYAVEAPENWFEDAGSGQLSNGSAIVSLEPTFAQTVNTGMDYHVFLTPNGDCKGLFVTQKTPTSFVVRELGGGTSNIAFDYRIMARRQAYENIRLADVTEQFNNVSSLLEKRNRPPENPNSVKPYHAESETPAHPVVLPMPARPVAGVGKPTRNLQLPTKTPPK